MKIKLATGILALLVIAMVACQNQDELEFKRYYTSGMVIYQSKCQNCHDAQGGGLSSLIPPLTDAEYLKANKHNLACFIKYGQKGLVTINGKTFNGQMPAHDLPAVEIAEVLTYINNSFGNKLGVVTTNEVDEDLKACK